MPSALPPSSPVNLDSNVPLSITQLSPNTDTSFVTYNTTDTQGWVNAGILDKYRSSETSSTISGLGGLLKSPFDTTLKYSYSMPTSYLSKTFSATPTQMPIKENPLNKYANYTYHIRFSMANEWSAYSTDIKEGNFAKRRIIAESGRTVGFNITKFSMNQTLGPGFKHQNINATTWRMTITEPFGLTFSDAMQAAATDLGVNNHHRFPLFIELWFNGYDENGTLIPQIDENKIWRVIILNCSLQTTEMGTVYELEGITDNDLSATNEIAVTQSFINLNEIRTLDEAINELEKRLNEDAKDAEGHERPISYKVELPEEMKSWKLIPSNAKEQSNREYDAKGGIITLAKGQDIGAFIITAISKCQEAKDWLEGTGNNSNGIYKASVVHEGLARYIQVVPKMNITRYNETLNDYVREITYYIVPFYTPRCASTVEEIQALSDQNVQINKFNFWCRNQMLAKQYEYIYTGKNTEVIKFDIAIENLWQIIVPPYRGGMNYSEFDVGAQFAERSQATSWNKNYPSKYLSNTEISARYALLQDLVRNVSNTVTNEVNAINSSVSSIGNSITSVTNNLSGLAGNFGLSGISSGVQNISGSVTSMTSAVSNAFNNLAVFTSLPITPFDYKYTGPFFESNNLLTKGTAATATKEPISSSQQRLKDTFIEEFIRKDQLPDDPHKIAAWVSNEPTQQQSTFNGLNPKSNIEKSGTMPRSQAMFGTKIFNIYEKTYFLNITLEIRGDPWWLGMSNLEMNEFLLNSNSLSGTNSTEWPDKGYANYLQGENVFLLNFRSGTDYDDETGLMKANTASQYFSGLYAVTEVEHRFDSGKFTQVLTAYKEPFSQKMNKQLISGVAPNISSSNNVSNVPGIIGGGENPNSTVPSNTITSDLSSQFRTFGNMTA